MFKKTVALAALVWVVIFAAESFSAPAYSQEMNYGMVSGKVVDEITGKGVEGITVEMNIEGGLTLTDKDGVFKFDKVPIDSEYEIMAVIDQEPYCSMIVEMNVRMKERQEVILKEIIAFRGGAIEGRIVGKDGSPVSTLSVTVYAEDEIPGVFGAVTDKTGYYRVSKLPPGKDLKVIAACWSISEGCGRKIREGIRVERGKTTKGVDFVISHDPPRIYGRIISRIGKPMRAYLTFWKGFEDLGNLLSDPDGYYSMTALETGHYRIHLGYGDEKHKISGDKELFLNTGDDIKMDIIISEDSVEFKTNKEEKKPSEKAGPLSSDEKSLAELIFSHNDAFSAELQDIILEAYENDVQIKVKSNCLPDRVRLRMLNLLYSSKPIYIVIRDKSKFRLREQKGRLFRVKQCGGTPQSSRVIYVYPDAFLKSCGSVAAILFHELLHVIGLKHDLIYPYTLNCYGNEAQEIPYNQKK